MKPLIVWIFWGAPHLFKSWFLDKWRLPHQVKHIWSASRKLVQLRHFPCFAFERKASWGAQSCIGCRLRHNVWLLESRQASESKIIGSLREQGGGWAAFFPGMVALVRRRVWWWCHRPLHSLSFILLCLLLIFMNNLAWIYTTFDISSSWVKLWS